MPKGDARKGKPLSPRDRAQMLAASKKSPWRGMGKMVGKKRKGEGG
jgi:hypothetical protein